MNLSEQNNVAVATAAATGIDLYIPFNKLHMSEKNSRTKPHTLQDIECRAASIKAYGLLNRLQVIEEPAPDGSKGHGVVAGGGRYLSIALLVNTGALPPDHPVKCELRSVDEAIAISVAENANRAPLHEADEFVAFKAMADEGKAVETIAAHFGLSVRTVQQRLCLGALHPRLIEAYRNGEMDKEQVRAFCRSTDQARQLQVWTALPQFNRSAWAIRTQLSKDSFTTTEPMVRFVGIDQYRRAGGIVMTDLFSHDNEGVIEDIALVHQLAVDKLRQIAGELVAEEGWAWSDIAESYDSRHYAEYEAAVPAQRSPTQEEQARLDTLGEELDCLLKKRDDLQEAADTRDDEEGDDEEGEDHVDGGPCTVTQPSAEALRQQIAEVEERITRIEGDIQALHAALSSYSEEVRATGGVVVALDGRGGVMVVRGLVSRCQPDAGEVLRPASSAPASTSPAFSGQYGGLDQQPAKKHRPDISERLANQPSAHRTAVMQACMIDRPDVAMAATVHRLLGTVTRRHRYGEQDVLKISGQSSLHLLHDRAPDLKGMRASNEVMARVDDWLARIPPSASEEFGWLLSLDAADLQELFALCVALTLDATVGSAGQQPDEALASALRIDVADYWSATAASYFDAVSKDTIIAAVEDACGRGTGMALVKMKKGEAAKHAEQKLAGTRWLPAMLRRPLSAGPDGVTVEGIPADSQVASALDNMDTDMDAALPAAAVM